MGKTAIIYYTWSWGNTERVAAYIANALDAYLFQIDTVEPYPRVEDLVVVRAKEEVFGKLTPTIKPIDIDLAQYETIILGCPVWWLSMAPAMRTFLTENKGALQGKRVACFVTRAKWKGSEIDDMEELLQGCKLLPSIEVEFGSEIAYELVTPEEELDAWLSEIEARS